MSKSARHKIDRRSFVGSSMATGIAAGIIPATNALASRSVNEEIAVGVMGLSRGRALAAAFAKEAGVRVKYVCDVDSQRAESTAKLLAKDNQPTPVAITDFRKMLEDPDVDAIVNATPNHWHGPATIMACSAGKNVYVEKPCCHNPREGEWMIAAARKNKKAVQVGTQRRSGQGWQEAVKRLRAGVIGRVYLARAWYDNARGSIGTGKAASVPDNLNYDLWQGPAPRLPYMSNRVHYNWHWFWHWGNGEVGNNGVHTIDLCRWGLNCDFPTRVTSGGGRYHFEDDQETPDTHSVSFEFQDRKQITWEGKSCNRHGGDFIKFYGDGGTMAVTAGGDFTILDPRDKQVDSYQASARGDREHILNFLDAIRNDRPLELNAEIAEGHKSTLLCHLGNIAQRTGRSLKCDPKNGHIRGDSQAMELWGRDYEPGWEPKV